MTENKKYKKTIIISLLIAPLFIAGLAIGNFQAVDAGTPIPDECRGLPTACDECQCALVMCIEDCGGQEICELNCPIRFNCDVVCEPPTAEIHVIKFNDTNGDGVLDPDEPGIPGWQITLQCNGEIGTVFTDANGMAWFIQLSTPAECTVSEEQRQRWVNTTQTNVTVSLNPGDDVGVIFGNQFQPPFETEKFYTDTNVNFKKGKLGDPLPFKDGNFVYGTTDSQAVKAVIHPKKGTISSYNPGQYYAVTKVTANEDLDRLWIFEKDMECTEETGISQWNPADVPGGAYVAMMCDGDTEDLTSELVKSGGLFRNNVTGLLEAHVHDVPKDCMVFLGVKYSPGLKGEVAELVTKENRFCENWEFVCLSQEDEPTAVPNPEGFPEECKSASFRDSAHRILEVTGLPDPACEACFNEYLNEFNACVGAGNPPSDCDEVLVPDFTECMQMCTTTTCDDCIAVFASTLFQCRIDIGSEVQCIGLAQDAFNACSETIDEVCTIG